MRKLETRTDIATSASTKDVVHTIRCHVRLVTIGNGISLSVHLASVNKRVSGSMSAISMNEGSHIRVVRLVGITTLDRGASLRWTLSAEWRHIRLPVSSRAFHQGLLLTVVVILIHHDDLNLDYVLVLDVVHHLIDFVRHENAHIRGHVRIRGLHQLVCPNDIWNLVKGQGTRLPCCLLG